MDGRSVRVVSVAVGLPAPRRDPRGRPYTTGIHKRPTAGPVRMGRENLVGDGQGDREHHGGVDKALCVYPQAHLAHWRRVLGRPVAPGGFGENLTVDATEVDVAIGDVYRLGDALLQVSQPRAPCWRLAHRWRWEPLAAEVRDTGYTGWYLRVLEEGSIAAGQRLELLERPHPRLTIAAANQVRRGAATGLLEEFADCEELSGDWRRHFAGRL